MCSAVVSAVGACARIVSPSNTHVLFVCPHCTEQVRGVDVQPVVCFSRAVACIPVNHYCSHVYEHAVMYAVCTDTGALICSTVVVVLLNKRAHVQCMQKQDRFLCSVPPVQNGAWGIDMQPICWCQKT